MAIKHGMPPIVTDQPQSNPALSTTVAGSSASISFATSGAFVLNYVAVDNAASQEATHTRWIFANALGRIACATTPVPVWSLPTSGTATLSGTLVIGIIAIPFSCGFTYPGR